jgi:ABC-type multidrug transport system fused ATPase/permease subunit
MQQTTDSQPSQPASSPLSWRELFAPLGPPLRQTRNLIIGTVIAGWAKFFLPLIVPWATSRVIDHVLSPEAAGRADRLDELAWLTGLCAVAIVLLGIATYFRHILTVRTVALVQHHLRRRLFHHVQRLSMAFFQRHHAGALGARVSSDIGYAGSLLDRGLIQYALDGVFFIVASGLLLWLDWRLTLAAYAVLALNAWVLWVYAPRIRRQQKAVQEGQSQVTGKAAEFFGAISLVKAYAGEREAADEFSARSARVRDLVLETSDFQARFQGWSFALLHLSTVAVLLLGSWLIIAHPGTLTVGGLVAFLLYLGSVNGTIQRMVEGINQLQEGLAALERIGELLRVLPTPADSPEAIEPPLAGRIEFRDVRFAYQGRPVIDGFSFPFERGRSYALVGPSGSGKSTLCQLMLRFWDPDAGEIRIDGHELRAIRQAWYRQNVAVVLQDPVIFSATVRDNIDFAVDGATQAQVERAAREAQAHDFIMALPQGYDTRLGERGVSLSGGQRQRIAIARALMRDPKLLILDEATSALDTVTEREIQAVIDRLHGSRTVVVIAHRLSTVRNVDEILVLDRGRLVEHGAWDSLIASGGVFARLAAEQESGRH